jgi:hypothetical protein
MVSTSFCLLFEERVEVGKIWFFWHRTIQMLLSQVANSSHVFAGLGGRRVTSLYSGHPALRPFGPAFGVRAAPAAQCSAKEK